MLHSRRHETPILQGFLSVKIAKTILPLLLKTGFYCVTQPLKNGITATLTAALPSRKS